MNASYIRVSTLDQAAHGTQDTQKESVNRFCTYKGIEINSWYYEQDSGAAVDRPEFKKLMQGVQDGRIRTVVVHALDRFSRSQIETLQAIEIIVAQKASFYAIRENISIVDGKKEPTTELVISIMSFFATTERDMIRSRTRLGRERKTQKGFWVQGQPPTGYELDHANKILKINEREADLILKIFRLRVSGHGINSIVKKLTMERVPFFEKKISFPGGRYCHVSSKPRKSGYCRIRHYQDAYSGCLECCSTNGGVEEDAETWCKTTITRILTNRVYIGMVRAKNGQDHHWIKAQHPPIIDVETFETVHSLIKQNSTQGTRLYRHNPLSGMVFCTQCGRAMHVTTGGRSRVSRVDGRMLKNYVAFRCPGRRVGLCDQPNVLAFNVYARVEGWVDLWLRNPDTIAFINVLFVIMNSSYYSALEDEIVQLSQSMKKTDAELKRLNKGYTQAILHGIDDDTLSSGILGELKIAKARKEELEARYSICQARRSEKPLLLGDVWFDLLENVSASWRSMMISESTGAFPEGITEKQNSVKVQIIKALVERVEVSGSEIYVKMKFRPEMLVQPLDEWIRSFIQLKQLTETQSPHPH